MNTVSPEGFVSDELAIQGLFDGSNGLSLAMELPDSSFNVGFESKSIRKERRSERVIGLSELLVVGASCRLLEPKRIPMNESWVWKAEVFDIFEAVLLQDQIPFGKETLKLASLKLIARHSPAAFRCSQATLFLRPLFWPVRLRLLRVS